VFGQSVSLSQDETSLAESLKWLTDEAQAVRIFAGAGSRIGVSIRDIADEDLKTGKGPAAGVIVDEVEEDSPAQKAGFKVGDVVVEFDGERVRSTRQFIRLVTETTTVRPVQAVVMRDGQRVTLSVQPRADGGFKYFNDVVSIAKVPPPAKVNRLFLDGFLAGYGRLGITIDDLSPQLAEYFGTKEGVLVTSVTDNSLASKAGLRAGDVITSLNGGTVSTTTDLRRRIQRLEGGDEFTIVVVRDKKTLTLKGKIDAPQPKRSTMRTII
jgi:serine protease Do